MCDVIERKSKKAKKERGFQMDSQDAKKKLGCVENEAGASEKLSRNTHSRTHVRGFDPIDTETFKLL